MPIMRKDVKLGLAVGGVLLAVLVVYVLVVPGNNANRPGADVTLDDGSTGAGSTGAGTTDIGTSTAQGDTGMRDAAIAGRDADATTHDTTGGSGEPASAGGSAKAEAPVAGSNAHSETANIGSTTDKPTGESAGGGWNWDALVAGTEKVPSLGASTDVATGAGAATNDAPRSHDNAIAQNSAVAQNAAVAQNSAGLGASGTAQAAPSQIDQTATAANAASSQDAGAVSPVTEGTLRSTDAAQLASAKTHVVKAGETYSKISQELFGTSRYYARIEQANPNIDPTRLKPGMAITIPAIDTTAAAPKAATPAAVAAQTATAAEKAIDPKTEYKVQPGDNLHNISLRLYGKADRMEKIYELNKATIGDDMARLKVGQVLKLPETPTQSTIAATR
jgi:nucleoid-associated protein YgaU